jgi:membrane protein DedA with SNARE-associated domain
LDDIARVLPDFIKHDPLVFFFAFLLLFAFVLPICEEIAVALVGVSAKAMHVNFIAVAAVSFIALLIQDLALFSLARFFGPKLIRHRFFSRFFKPDRIEAAERYFLNKGPVILISSRFIVGLRISAILGSGLLKMKWNRFLFFDGVAAAVMTPGWLFVGFALGSQFDKSADVLTKVITIVGLCAVLIAVTLIYKNFKT